MASCSLRLNRDLLCEPVLPVVRVARLVGEVTMRVIVLCAVLLLSVPVLGVVGPSAQEPAASAVKLLWEFDAGG
jgi:hypothetical protein